MSQAASWNRVERRVIWLAASALWVAALAWIAFQIQQEGIAPAVLFPLAVGGALAAGEVAIFRFAGVTITRGSIAAVCGLGLLVVVGQDYIGHRHRLREYEHAFERQEPSLAVAMSEADEMRPTFAAYLARRASGQPVWWALDLTCTVAAAGLATVLAARRMRSP